MVAMAKSQRKKPNRSPSYQIAARIDPTYEAKIEQIKEKAHPFTPTLAQIVERGIDLVLAEVEKKETDKKE